MALLDDWKALAYNQESDRRTFDKFWDEYFEKEKNIYKILLKDEEARAPGTVKELADRFGLDTVTMAGFLDGINDSLVDANPIDTMEEDTKVSLNYDNEKLFRNMVEAKADWLYELPEWDDIFDEATRKELYTSQKKAHTVVNTNKIGRNDPCPCGSGRKYKQCCGKKKAG